MSALGPDLEIVSRLVVRGAWFPCSVPSPGYPLSMLESPCWQDRGVSLLRFQHSVLSFIQLEIRERRVRTSAL